jgi:hypothetical protein
LPTPNMADLKQFPLPKLDRDAEVTERNRGQIRPQHTELFEFVIGASLHQQGNEIADSAAVESGVSVLDDSGNVTKGKSGVLVREATFDVVKESPLFLRHPAIVTAILTGVKTSRVNSFFVNRWKKTLLRRLDGE